MGSTRTGRWWRLRALHEEIFDRPRRLAQTELERFAPTCVSARGKGLSVRWCTSTRGKTWARCEFEATGPKTTWRTKRETPVDCRIVALVLTVLQYSLGNRARAEVSGQECLQCASTARESKELGFLGAAATARYPLSTSLLICSKSPAKQHSYARIAKKSHT